MSERSLAPSLPGQAPCRDSVVDVHGHALAGRIVTRCSAVMLVEGGPLRISPVARARFCSALRLSLLRWRSALGVPSSSPLLPCYRHGGPPAPARRATAIVAAVLTRGTEQSAQCEAPVAAVRKSAREKSGGPSARPANARRRAEQSAQCRGRRGRAQSARDKSGALVPALQTRGAEQSGAIGVALPK